MDKFKKAIQIISGVVLTLIGGFSLFILLDSTLSPNKGITSSIPHIPFIVYGLCMLVPIGILQIVFSLKRNEVLGKFKKIINVTSSVILTLLSGFYLFCRVTLGPLAANGISSYDFLPALGLLIIGILQIIFSLEKKQKQ